MIKPVMKYDEVLRLAFARKSNCYYYILRKNRHCFTGNVKHDVEEANKIITTTKVNNTGHVVAASFTWGFNLFYGKEFNTKYLASRSQEISKFTTRLDRNDIRYIRLKFEAYVNEADHLAYNIVDLTRQARKRLYFAFEALLASGMRVGELCSINFWEKPLSRVITSKITGHKDVEIIINTEKTCKKREVYIPLEAYEWFENDNTRLTIDMIAHGLAKFAKWAKFKFRLTSHVLRRTKASIMHEMGVDVNTIAMVLGNTPAVVEKHYIISSARNYDACDIANGAMNGSITKTSNMYWNQTYMAKQEHKEGNVDDERTRKDDYLPS